MTKKLKIKAWAVVDQSGLVEVSACDTKNHVCYYAIYSSIQLAEQCPEMLRFPPEKSYQNYKIIPVEINQLKERIRG